MDPRKFRAPKLSISFGNAKITKSETIPDAPREFPGQARIFPGQARAFPELARISPGLENALPETAISRKYENRHHAPVPAYGFSGDPAAIN